MDGDVFDNNEIIFCDKCNVAVHQQCYGVITIPEGEWLCEVCAAGEDPATTTCELCSNTGGAYKPVDRPGKWIHSLCATWVPEVFVSENNGNSIYTLSHLDKKRFKLKCTLCNTSKGASVQCSYGKCVTPAHPWCAIHMPEKGDFIVRSYILYTPFQHILPHNTFSTHLPTHVECISSYSSFTHLNTSNTSYYSHSSYHPPHLPFPFSSPPPFHSHSLLITTSSGQPLSTGFTRRIVKNEDGETVWEIFCKVPHRLHTLSPHIGSIHLITSTYFIMNLHHLLSLPPTIPTNTPCPPVLFLITHVLMVHPNPPAET